MEIKEKKKTLWFKSHSVGSVNTITSLCLHESLFSSVTDFFLTHAHPTFVNKLNINNHKTVSNEKDIKNLMSLNQNFFCSLFHIIMTKTNYDQ